MRVKRKYFCFSFHYLEDILAVSVDAKIPVEDHSHVEMHAVNLWSVQKRYGIIIYNSLVGTCRC